VLMTTTAQKEGEKDFGLLVARGLLRAPPSRAQG
jgi:hypothetical protein